ncbi:MAG: NAD(P)-dependent oxidoreductase [Verrucomicrobiales bacterium]|nr:NAD(P)-dependent oxidoreductase [Verrucomicrobiales bacterium]
MRVLIVGCGYVGLSLGRTLVDQGHEVHGLRRTADGVAEMETVGLKPHRVDITANGSLEALPGDFDWVINTASSSRGDAAMHHEVFVEGTRNLVERFERSQARLLFTSSTSVYPQTDGGWVDEESFDEPVVGTAQNLALAEEMYLKHPGGATLLRVAGIYGPSRGHLYRQFLKGKAVIEGEGNRWVNMIHRDDVVTAILCAMENEMGIYNVTDNEPVTHRSFLEWLAGQLERPLPVSGDPISSGKRARTNKRVSNARLKATGWIPQFPTFREGYTALLQSEGVL